MRLTCRDKLAIALVRIVHALGYRFYVRQFFDDTRFNGNDIAIYRANSDTHLNDIIAVANGRCKISSRYSFVGKN